MADIPLLVVSDNSSSERRITPSWSISTLKAKLEPVTGVPPSSQRIFLKASAQESIPIAANDEDSAYLASFPLVAYAELHVSVLILLRWCLVAVAPFPFPCPTKHVGGDHSCPTTAETYHQSRTGRRQHWKRQHRLLLCCRSPLHDVHFRSLTPRTIVCMLMPTLLAPTRQTTSSSETNSCLVITTRLVRVHS